MKKNLFLSVILLSIMLSGCSSKKTSEAKTPDTLITFYDTTWELEYISGPRIAFEGLYPETKPTLIFTAADNQYGGNNSCNVYSGKFTKKDSNIHFGDAIKTMRFCDGGAEETFMGMLGKVNKWAINSDRKLVLLADDIPMMRFKKIAKSKN